MTSLGKSVNETRLLAASLLFSLCFAVTQSKSSRIEVDLLKLMDGKFANTTVALTLTLDDGQVTAVFAGDKESYQIEDLYILFANSSTYIAQIQLNKQGSGQLSTFSAPYISIDRDVGGVQLAFTDSSTWKGAATVTLPSITGQIKYSVFAKLDGGDPDSCSSYLGTYSLTNAAVSLADMYVVDLFDDFASRS